MTESDRSTRLEALHKLYLQSYSEMWAAAASDSNLLIGDADTLLRTVARLLEQYPGPDDDSGAFAQWATETIIQPGVERMAAFYVLREQNRKVVFKAIWTVLKVSDDLGVNLPGKQLGTLGEIESEVWTKVFLDLDGWLSPGTSTRGREPAKVSTRLYGFARDQALGWQKNQIRHRRKKDIADSVAKTLRALQMGATGAKKPSLSEIERAA
jgi:hypothetical protein